MTPELILSSLALVLAATSIAVHVYQWKRSGPRVKVQARQAFLAFDGGGVGRPQVSVTAHNDGRSPVTVSNWGFTTPQGEQIVFPQPQPGSTPLPHRLEPESDATWFGPTAEIIETCKSRGIDYRKIRATVVLAGGKRAHAKDPGIGLK